MIKYKVTGHLKSKNGEGVSITRVWCVLGDRLSEENKRTFREEIARELTKRLPSCANADEYEESIPFISNLRMSYTIIK